MSHGPARRRRRAAFEGLLAAVPALALGWAIGAARPSLPFAPVALADRLVRLAPGSLETFAVEHLQHAALPLLAVATTVCFLALGAVLGLAFSSSRAPAAASGLGFGAALAGGELAAPVTPAPAAALASASAAGVLYAAVLLRLRRAQPRRAAFDPGRRRVLLRLGAGTAALLLGGTALGRLIASPARVPVGGLRRPAVPPRRPFPRIDGLSPELTPVASHYVVDIDLNDPVLDTGDWRLTVEGLVERPLRLDFEELQRFSLVGEYSVLTCISNRVGGPLVGNSLWHGVRLRELLAAAVPRSHAREIVFECADGYTAALPLEQAIHPSVLVAIAQNGRSLTREHGFPCRLRAPAFYGIKNPKWIESIVLTDERFEGYWQRQGWTDTALVRTEARIDAPDVAAAGEPTWIAGIAWAGLRGIAAVELSTDGGRTWRRAQLQRPLSAQAWTRWAYRWAPPRPGHYELACRAIDGHGRVQDPTRRPPHPSGASGYHQRTLEVA